MKKFIQLIATALIASSLIIGCNNDEKPSDVNENPGVTEDSADAVTSASKVTDEKTLKKALGSDGSWIILLQKDITSKNDLVVEGEFTKPDKDNQGNMVPAGRNITLYNKDSEGNISATYTLTVPKLTIKSTETIIKDGVVKGDIYVEAQNFKLYKTKVEGNVYFKNKDYKDTFQLEEGATVTGKIEIK